jgi:Putative transposase/Transposase zinc-binding domain
MANQPQAEKLTIAGIFRQHHAAFREAYRPTPAQSRVIDNIMACRTAVLGGRLQVCPNCNDSVPLYNSCRNRHCPTCQNAKQAQWLANREQTILPTPYFHVVFTLPESLRQVVRQNPRLLLALLMRCAANTVLTLGKDPKRLDAQLGITAVLHTWTRTLIYHPHVHCVVTGGGLRVDNQRWVSTHEGFLFAANVVGRLFRGRFMSEIRALYAQKELTLDGPLAHLRHPDEFRHFKEALYDQKWVVYAKQPFGGPQHVFAYLGRYTHRVGLTDARLVEVTDTTVTFRTKEQRTTTVTPLEFLRRFTLHVLPKNFVRIRHYGLLAAKNVKEKIPIARALLEKQKRPPIQVQQPQVEAAEPQKADDEKSAERHEIIRTGSWIDRFFALTGIDLTLCQRCGLKRVERILQPCWDTS